MVEHKSKMTDSGVLYIPKELRQAFGRTVRIIPNACAALFIPENVSLVNALKSLEIIKMDLTHRLAMQEEEIKRGELK